MDILAHCGSAPIGSLAHSNQNSSSRLSTTRRSKTWALRLGSQYKLITETRREKTSLKNSSSLGHEVFKLHPYNHTKVNRQNLTPTHISDLLLLAQDRILHSTQCLAR